MNALPGFSTLRQIFYAFHIPMDSLLIGYANAWDFASVRPLPSLLRTLKPKRKPAVQQGWKALEAYFQEILNDQHPRIRSF
jgi:hypothetical protein